MKREGPGLFHRPRYRWKSFWLGVLVLGFLSWAWVRSMSHLDLVSMISSSATEAVAFRSHGGLLSLQATGPRHFLLPKNPQVYRASFPTALDPKWFAPPAFFEEPGSPGEWTLSVAHWLLVLLFLVPWAIFLVWRGWRMKRLAREAADPATDAGD